ncbi:MAG: SWIM zinc finger family protein, partial [Ilumatobacteraceae bacterium]
MADGERWTVEQVVAVAPSPRAIVAAEPLAVGPRWSALGVDDRALWGRCRGSGAEPYDTMVDHAEVAWRCTCPSRKLPCKHSLALLLLWVRGGVVEAARPSAVESWIAARDRAAGPQPGTATSSSGEPGEGAVAPAPVDETPDISDTPPPIDRDQLDRSRDERVARMKEGLLELDRWLEDRMRTGLADPALARYATWDQLAARLIDARAGSLANRVRRLAGLVGASPDWHAEVLAELGMLHLIAEAGRRLPELPGPLADAVATASGWQVRQADVLLGVPDTDEWFVAGRSDVREDRIEVRRLWLRGVRSERWAMLLSFAAYQQSLDDTWVVGTIVHADLHRYPGGSIRSLAG